MKRLFDFKCAYCDHTFEALADENERTHSCRCGEEAKRRISTPSIRLDGCSGHFPTAADHWANIRDQNAKVKAKNKDPETA